MTKKTARNVPVTIVDDNGYETDGMYRWGGPKAPLSEESIERWVNEFNSELSQSAIDRISTIREWLTNVILPHVDGPVSDKIARTMYGRVVMFLNLSTGSGCYAFHSGLPSKSYLDNASDAIRELDALSELVVLQPLKVDRIVRSSVRVGMLVTRTQLRAYFAAEVLSAKKRRKASAKGGSATAKWNAKIARIARGIFAGEKRQKVSDAAAYRRTVAKLKSQHDIVISATTVRRRLNTDASAGK